MPPKKSPPVDVASPEGKAASERLHSLGLSAARIKDVLQSSRGTSGLLTLLDAHPNDLGSGTNALEEKQASLVVDLSKELGYDTLKEGEQQSVRLNREEESHVIKRIRDGRYKSSDQVKAGVTYLESNRSAAVDDAALDAASGVGVSFTPESLLSLLQDYLKRLAAAGPDGGSPRSWSDLIPFRKGLIGGVPELRWANGRDLTTAVDQTFTTLFGDKKQAQQQAQAEAAAAKKKKASAAPAASAQADKKKTDESSAAAANVVNPTAAPNPTSLFADGFLSKLHRPGENPQQSAALREAHLAATGGLVHTRFPPEPNGYLHIGHAKAIAIDFGYAKHHGGRCYLRFDDTNPEAEEGRYFDSILEMVRWLGFEPWRITYSSDNFDRLYEIALKLTREGKAFVCECDQAQMAALKGGGRGSPAPCPHRDRPVEENVREFERMREGAYPEKSAVLRLKIDLTSGNPYLWDPVAYRVKLAPHHRTGDRWKIYPTYDFTHPLCDSFENISHSLCTLEFVDARASYEWLCDAAGVYKPRQYETARLSLQGTFLSKRKIRTLVEKGHVTAWDDPRLFTLIALRRRGIPPAAMLRFVEELGVSLANSETRLDRFENAIRQTLELGVARLSLVLDPVRVTIANVADDWQHAIERPFHPKVEAMGKHTAILRKHALIDRDDFRVDPPADFFRLAPGRSVILMGAPFPVTCTEYRTDDSGRVTEIICALEDGSGPNGDRKFKSKDAPAIHWVDRDTAVTVDEVRFFEPLFRSDDPSKLDDFEADINPDSLKVHKGAVIEPSFFKLAQNLMRDARTEAEKRTKEAANFSQGHVESSATTSEPAAMTSTGVTPVPHGDDDTPVATASQLIGMECIRFQAMRLAYFAVDREAQLGCLEGGDAVRRDGDKIILNKIVSLKEEKSKKAT